MTNKELISRIRLEIKRMISAHKTKNGFPKGSFCAVRIEAYNEVLDLLDTFKEPVSEDLEKEIDAYYKEWDGDCRYAQTAHHFAQWGAEHFRGVTKMVSEDLEEAAEGEWIWATTPPEKPGKYKVQLRYDTYSAIWNGVKWIDDASRFPIMGVFKWKPIKEDRQ